MTRFGLWAPDATAVAVCLPSGQGVETRILLDGPTAGRWQADLPHVRPGQRYGFRARGPYDPAAGHRFNPNRLLLDPYARAICGRLDPSGPVFDVPPDDPSWSLDSAPYVPWSVVVDDRFDWGDDARPQTAWPDTVIYEAHVRGLTMLHPDVPDRLRGTYAGLAHPAVTGELVRLGVTAVELLPVHHFVTEPAVTARGLANYWGYNSVGFFAPHGAYSSTGDRGGQVTEFKQLVRSLHAAGLEVLLDVVYNHTGESGAGGPVLSLRGLDDDYYLRRPDGTYEDVTGCGNTLAAARPAGLGLVLDSLRYWVEQMHVDGFRFDLAPALLRTEDGVDLRAPLLRAIEQDPVLRDVKLIAEPWDVTAEGYLVGRFPAPWREWNDRFRDTVRDFWRGRSGGVRDLAYRLSGSSDLYGDSGRFPVSSVNFVTAHDGFTLRDLVSYDHKHNEANGEHGRDGTDNNRSWNGGVEGDTDDADLRALRGRQAANLLGTLLLAQGVPMLVAGDERGRTQQGNNNAYCHDGPLTWVDWHSDPDWEHLHALTSTLLALRRKHAALRQRRHLMGRPIRDGVGKDVAWLHPSGAEMGEQEWYDHRLATVGMLLHGKHLRDQTFLLWLHAGTDAALLVAPGEPWAPAGWEVVLDTSAETAATADGLLAPGRTLLLLRAR